MWCGPEPSPTKKHCIRFFPRTNKTLPKLKASLSISVASNLTTSKYWVHLTGTEFRSKNKVLAELSQETAYKRICLTCSRFSASQCISSWWDLELWNSISQPRYMLASMNRHSLLGEICLVYCSMVTVFMDLPNRHWDHSLAPLRLWEPKMFSDIGKYFLGSKITTNVHGAPYQTKQQPNNVEPVILLSFPPLGGTTVCLEWLEIATFKASLRYKHLDVLLALDIGKTDVHIKIPTSHAVWDLHSP